jgi:hypothetical protein
MKRALRAAQGIAASGFLAGGLVITSGIGGCSSDSGSSGSGGRDSSAPLEDATADSGTDGATPGTDAPSGVTPTPDSGATASDSGTTEGDSGTAADAPVDAPLEAAVKTFCQTQSGLDFCADFDEQDALSTDGGATGTWTQLVGSELGLSTAQASSAPHSLLVAMQDGPANTDQSAKVVEWLTPTSGVTQAIYEFDIYIDTVPLANVGGFATDFQFLDTSGGSDQFGFRIGVFANTTGFDHADLEHNHPTLGGNDDITSPIAITAKAWNHVKMSVAFAALAGDGGDSVAFQLYLNKSATPAVDANYPAPFSKAAFARFAAGMVYAFDATNKDWGIYYDNFTLKLQ